MLAVAVMCAAPAQVVAQAEHRTEQVHFAAGSSSAVINGRLKGYEYVDYRVRSGAGQVMTVTMKGSNGANYFNLLPPGSTDVAMFIGSSSGSEFKGTLPADGEYSVRVYLMRSAARRNETSTYTLTISVTGKPLAAVPAKVDALIPGTPFHASTTITCEYPGSSGPGKCEAFVTRRGFDGTATVEIRWAEGMKRRILFVKGKPVASDSPDPLSSSRQGDLTTVRLGTEERFDIPDALVFGG